jgi:hypothetical protein
VMFDPACCCSGFLLLVGSGRQHTEIICTQLLRWHATCASFAGDGSPSYGDEHSKHRCF